jgi:hypothetical protein
MGSVRKAIAWAERALWAQPLWVVGAAYLALLLLAAGAGVAAGRRELGLAPSANTPVATVQTALLGLLALLLAFTYYQAADRFELRRSLFVAETNAITTLWLRASFLSEPDRAELREALAEYAELQAVPDMARLDIAAVEDRFRAAEALHAPMWASGTRRTQTNPPTALDSLLASALNDLIALHTSRISSYQNRVPASALFLLSGLSVLCVLLMGFGFGEAAPSRAGLLGVLALAITGATLCILDLDQSHRGWARISQNTRRHVVAQLRNR